MSRRAPTKEVGCDIPVQLLEFTTLHWCIPMNTNDQYKGICQIVVPLYRVNYASSECMRM